MLQDARASLVTMEQQVHLAHRVKMDHPALLDCLVRQVQGEILVRWVHQAHEGHQEDKEDGASKGRWELLENKVHRVTKAPRVQLDQLDFLALMDKWANLDIMERMGKRERGDLMGLQVKMACQAQGVPQDPLDLLEVMAKMEKRVLEEKMASLENLGHRDPQEQVAAWGKMGRKENRVHQVNLVPLDQLELKGLRELVVTLENAERQVNLELMVLPVSEAFLVQLVSQV